MVTVQEAYNLLSGRAVYREKITSKDKIIYNAWVQLDFTQTDSKGNFKWHSFHENYGYDLETVLMKYPIQELDDSTSYGQLIYALRRGNREAVTMMVNGRADRYFIEALPRFKSLTICDAFNNPLPGNAIAALVAPCQQSDMESIAAPVVRQKTKRRRIPIK